MKRSFRVATVFTGVAALAGGFGPQAFAVTAGPLSRTGSIRNQVCGANNNNVSHWVHLYYVHNDHPAECFGFRGKTTASATIASQCAGNNNGNLTINSFPFNEHLSAGAGRSGAFNGAAHVTAVSITGWSGSARC